MSVLTLATNVQLTPTTDISITASALATTLPLATQVILYSNLADADDFRKAEIYRGWESLYMGWKRVAYDAFDGGAPTVPHYIAADLSSPIPEYRIYTTDQALIVEGMVGFGIGADFIAAATVGKNILECRTAFDRLRDYYLENYGKK
jgi:hypothetical protein